MLDYWHERAGIMEYGAGMSRFEAETKAAQAIGETRWRMIDADRKRNFEQARDRGSAVERNDARQMPAVQPSEEKQK